MPNLTVYIQRTKKQMPKIGKKYTKFCLFAGDHLCRKSQRIYKIPKTIKSKIVEYNMLPKYQWKINIRKDSVTIYYGNPSENHSDLPPHTD